MRIPSPFSFLDRELILWGLAPCTFAIMLVACFALPNYMRAKHLREDSDRLKAVTDETRTAQNNLRKLEELVSSLRGERDRRCRPLVEGVERDRLLGAITRSSDGVAVQEQSIRTGQMAVAEGMPEDYPVERREIMVEMQGTFDSIFSVLDSAESVDQLVTPKSVEISLIPGPLEQAQTGACTVRANMVFEEWFAPKKQTASASSASGASSTTSATKQEGAR